MPYQLFPLFFPIIKIACYFRYTNDDLHDILGMGFSSGPRKNDNDNPDRAQWQIFGFQGIVLIFIQIRSGLDSYELFLVERII